MKAANNMVMHAVDKAAHDKQAFAGKVDLAAEALSEIASQARDLVNCLNVAIDEDNPVELLPAARALCQQIGWTADRVFRALHGQAVSDDRGCGVVGGADAWLLTPLAKDLIAQSWASEDAA